MPAISAQSSWGLSLSQAEKYRKRLTAMQQEMKVGDWYEHTYWVKANTGLGEGRYETEMLKIVGIYPHHISFEHTNGLRESYTYPEVANEMEKMQNTSLLDWSDKN